MLTPIKSVLYPKVSICSLNSENFKNNVLKYWLDYRTVGACWAI